MTTASLRGRAAPLATDHGRRCRLTRLAIAVAIATATAGAAGAAELRLADGSDSLGLKVNPASPIGDRLDAAPPQPSVEAERPFAVPGQPSRSCPLRSIPYFADIPSSWQAAQAEQKAEKQAARAAGRDREWGEGEKRKSYLIPALEIVGFDTLLNLFQPCVLRLLRLRLGLQFDR